MVLRAQTPSKHNQMLGKWIQKARPTPADKTDARPSKRPRLEDTTSDSESAPQTPGTLGVEEEEEDRDTLQEGRRTDLESALPEIETGADAIEEYEVFKASHNEEEETAEGRFKDRKWLKGRTSIYVDAFNLALDTVLDEESHLFDEAEMEVFRVWRGLEYEAQYLYVIVSMWNG
jgi:Fanconi-associated nuclease 1